MFLFFLLNLKNSEVCPVSLISLPNQVFIYMYLTKPKKHSLTISTIVNKNRNVNEQYNLFLKPKIFILDFFFCFSLAVLFELSEMA